MEVGVPLVAFMPATDMARDTVRLASSWRRRPWKQKQGSATRFDTFRGISAAQHACLVPVRLFLLRTGARFLLSSSAGSLPW